MKYWLSHQIKKSQKLAVNGFCWVVHSWYAWEESFAPHSLWGDPAKEVKVTCRICQKEKLSWTDEQSIESLELGKFLTKSLINPRRSSQ